MSEWAVIVTAANGRAGGDRRVRAKTAENAERNVRASLGDEWADATYEVQAVPSS